MGSKQFVNITDCPDVPQLEKPLMTIIATEAIKINFLFLIKYSSMV